jgi:hypothetical protein
VRPRYLGLLLFMTLLFGSASIVRADGPIVRMSGPYEISASYAVDPPYMEEGNALLLNVRDTRTGEPVTGLENALKVQGTVTLLETSKSYPVPLRRSLEQPGLYEAVFVPPSPGTYIFDVTGVIEGTQVHQQFTSGGGGLPEAIHRTTGKYDETGVYVALVIALAYVVGLVILLGIAGVRRFRGTPRAAA